MCVEKLCSSSANNFKLPCVKDPVIKQSIVLCSEFCLKLLEISNSGIRACPGSLKASEKLKEGFIVAVASPAE